MEPSCVRQTLIPGTSKLFGDYLYDFERVNEFLPVHFEAEDQLAESARQLSFPEGRRAFLVSALKKQNPDSPALRKLAQPGTVAVVTGQQVGLLSGPAYTIFKALTAVKLAGHLESQGISAVPVFWLATEDHDLAEVDHAWVFDQEANPTKIAVTGSVVNGGPVGHVKFNESPLEGLRAALGDLPFADETVGHLERQYRAGQTFGCAFRLFLQDLLKNCGILFLDPLEPEIREIAAPFLTEAVDRVPELVDALKERGLRLSESGYHTQVLVEGNASLLFLLNEGKREPLRLSNGNFAGKNGSFSAAELKAQANKLSPNALLRPVMQDYLLPTVAYVGGPAEIAYMAQSQVIYQKLLGRMPVIYPRNGFTLLDQRAVKLLHKYGLSIPDLLDHKEKVTGKIASKLVPSPVREEIAQLKTSVSNAVARAQIMLNDFDPTLATAANKSKAKILYQVGKLSQRTSREMLRRDERAAHDAEYLMNLIYPRGHLQERFYSIVPFLAKHGWDLPYRLLEQTQFTCPDHMIREI